MQQVNDLDLAELSALEPPAADEEIAWAVNEAYNVDPGTDSPAMKLLQRRRTAALEQAKVNAEAEAESPLVKFGRVWERSSDAQA